MYISHESERSWTAVDSVGLAAQCNTLSTSLQVVNFVACLCIVMCVRALALETSVFMPLLKLCYAELERIEFVCCSLHILQQHYFLRNHCCYCYH
jgi:hypothetical protein